MRQVLLCVNECAVRYVSEHTNLDILGDGFEGLEIGLIILDGDLRILTSNSRFKAILEIPPKLLGTKAEFSEIVKFCHDRRDFEVAGMQITVPELLAKLNRREEKTYEYRAYCQHYKW